MKKDMPWLALVFWLTTSRGAIDATEPSLFEKEEVKSHFKLGTIVARETRSCLKGVALTLSFLLFLICYRFLIETYKACPTSGNDLLGLIQRIFQKGTFLDTWWTWLYVILSLPAIWPMILYAFVVPGHPFLGDEPRFFPLAVAILSGSIILTCRLMGAYASYAQFIKRTLTKKKITSWIKKAKTLDYNALLKKGAHQIQQISCKLILRGAAFLLGALVIFLPIFIVDAHTYYKKYQRGWCLLEEELNHYHKNLPLLKKMKQSLRIKPLINDAKEKRPLILSDLPPKLSSDRFPQKNTKRCIGCKKTCTNCFAFKKNTYKWSVCWDCYRLHYADRVDEETQKLIQHIEKEQADKPDYEPSFDFYSICCACSMKEDHTQKACFGTKEKGLYPICAACYKHAKTNTQHIRVSHSSPLGMFFKKIISADNNGTRQPQTPFPIDAIDPFAFHVNRVHTIVGAYNQLNGYLTCQELYDLGASKAVREAYREKTAYRLRVSMDECFICGNKHSETATCPYKKAVFKKLSHRHARYAENGEEDFYLAYGFKQLVCFLYRFFRRNIDTDTAVSAHYNWLRVWYYNYLKIEQPCPWCGYLTDKDDQCDHIHACLNCQKSWYFFTGKSVRAISYWHPFVPRTYQLDKSITPFKAPGLLGSRHYSSIMLPSMDLL